jgi:hypothetical protein
LVRKHDYQLKIDIISDENYDLTYDLNPYLKPRELLKIAELLKDQEDKLHQKIINKSNIIKK